MHPNPAFHTASETRNCEFARHRGFGVLAVNGPDAPYLSHLPFLLDTCGTKAWLHLVRSNPIARLPDDQIPARLAVSGPDSYVSPDWYATQDQVPTWNYVAVHLTGRLQRCPQETLREVIDRQSALFEKRLAPRHPWRTDKMPPDVLERMMRQIVPYVMQIDRVEGTWKLNQNKPDSARLGAAAQVEGVGMGHETATLAALMRGVDGTGSA